MTTTGELRAIIEDASTPEPFVSIAVDRLNDLKRKSIPPRIGAALKAEGEAYKREFEGWADDPPDTIVRLGRLRAFSVWCSRVSAELRKP